MDSRPLLFKALATMPDVVDFSKIPHVPVCLDRSYVALASLKASLTKKLVPREKHVLEATRQEAYNLFVRMNDRCRTFALQPDILINQMRMFAERDFSEVQDWQDLLNASGLICGSGASVSSNGRNSSFEKFFVNDITTTNPFLYGEYIRYIKEDSSALISERLRRALRGQAFELVDGSNLSSVPKNDRIDRMICTEPSLNMFFQRSLGEHINKVLARSYGYDPALQPDRNRNLARLGSSVPLIGTIDLSSASDTISYKLCKEILPTWLMAAIDDCRCKQTIYSFSKEVVHLDMVATMGNGFTFPLQTYIFSNLIRTLCFLNNVRFTRFSQRGSFFGVFGDDIVVPTDLFDPCMQALKQLGMIPNPDKSFNHGYFRESCGTDWYHGANVRGVYCKNLNCIQDRYSLCNRLLRFAALHRLDLSEMIRVILPPSWKQNLIPFDEPDTAGFKTPTSYATHLLTRHGLFRYRRYSACTKKFKLWLDGDLIKSHWNPYGIVKAACVTQRISLGLDRRSTEVRYQTCTMHTPVWVAEWQVNGHDLSLSDWEAAFAVNVLDPGISRY